MDVMRARRSWVFPAATGLLLTLAQPAAASELGEAAASLVTESSYRYFLGDDQGVEGILYTHIGDDRGFGVQHDWARANIVAEFDDFGLDVILEPFNYLTGTYYNVVATQLGTTYPDQEYIIGAHFDSVNNPGADDNASGVAGVLEAARVLSRYESEYTIRYIAFDREEQGLYGSTGYATAHQSDDILGMISADMLAFEPGPGAGSALIYGRTASDPIKNTLASAVTTYGQGMTPNVQGRLDASDHVPFEARGFQACLFIEGATWMNPFYHTANDNVEQAGNINYDFARRMTRVMVGYLVDNANVLVIIPDGDYDENGLVDLYDVSWFQACFSGTVLSYPPGMGCMVFDFDVDDDVDADDYAELSALLSGP